jgi:hypothetical protein
MSINKPPFWFFGVSVFALIWNLIGGANYLWQVTMSDEMKAELPAEYQEFIDATPVWATSAFAIAVWAGILASIFLLMRKSWAYTLFIASFIGILIQNIYGYLVADGLRVLGPSAAAVSILVLGLSVFFILFSRQGIKRKWLG